MFMREIGFNYFVCLLMSLSGFSIGLIEGMGTCFAFFYFLEEYVKIILVSSYMFN